MQSYLSITITFLDGTYHGRQDDGVPEWPPSPLRLFQAMVRTGAARFKTPFPDKIEVALTWLAKQQPPIIIASGSLLGSPYVSYVPNNAMDIVANLWSQKKETSKEAQPATHKASKENRTTYMNSPGSVTYAWAFDEDSPEVNNHIEHIHFLTAQLVAVGWGIDLVAGDAKFISEEELTQLPGERWEPTVSHSNGLRVANEITLQALTSRHQQFLNRLSSSGKQLSPVPVLSPNAYSKINYRRVWEPAVPTIAAFEFLKLDTRGWQAFDTLKACKVAGMLRHATAETAKQAGWNEDRIDTFISGHAEPRNETHKPVGRTRFSYVPLPSLQPRSENKAALHVGAIRRALLFVPAGGHASEIDWVRRSLSGSELIDIDHNSQAIISLMRENDNQVARYTQTASTWTTVTPVILPGYDDPKHYRRRIKKGVSASEQKRLLEKLSNRIDRLLRNAIQQAGFSSVLAEHAEIEWRKIGYLPGADHVNRSLVPRHLRKFPAYHVRITWRDPNGQPVKIPGPILFGGGRYCGLGLFTNIETQE